MAVVGENSMAIDSRIGRLRPCQEVTLMVVRRDCSGAMKKGWST
jgi:hypothetical protein